MFCTTNGLDVKASICHGPQNIFLKKGQAVNITENAGFVRKCLLVLYGVLIKTLDVVLKFKDQLPFVMLPPGTKFLPRVQYSTGSALILRAAWLASVAPQSQYLVVYCTSRIVQSGGFLHLWHPLKVYWNTPKCLNIFTTYKPAFNIISNYTHLKHWKDRASRAVNSHHFINFKS